jgi:uncharacterized small protein (DUF1192 family)
MDDDDDKPQAPVPVLPPDLSSLSIEELTEAISCLEAEVGRARAAIAAKKSVRSGADSLFSFDGGKGGAS